MTTGIIFSFLFVVLCFVSDWFIVAFFGVVIAYLAVNLIAGEMKNLKKNTK